MQPERYIQSSDYATLASNIPDPVLVSVTVPNGSSATVSNTVTVPTAGAPISFSIHNSATDEEWACQQMQYVSPNGQSVNVRVRQTSANQVTITAQPFFGAIDGGNVTFTARIRAFVPPIP